MCATRSIADVQHSEAQSAVYKIGSAFENDAKVPKALTTLINMKDNHIFRGLRTLIAPGALPMLPCAMGLRPLERHMLGLLLR